METADQRSEESLLWEYNENLRQTVLPVTIIFGVEIFFGIFGNILTLYVFYFRYKACNFRYFVLCLALIDLISCMTTIPGEMVSQIFWYNYPVPTVCKVKAFFNQFTVCGEAACLSVIAIDRYRKVCKPFGWQIKKNLAKALCIGIYAVATVLAIPTPIFWGVHKDVTIYRGRNITVTVCEKDENYRETILPLANIAFNQSLVFMTLICMFVLYILVAKKLILGQKLLKRRSIQSADELVESSTDTNSKDLPPKSNNYKVDPNSLSEDESGGDKKLQKQNQRLGNELCKMVKVRRKTLIMLYLTVIFIVTTVLYGVLLSVVANGILPTLNDSSKVLFFFLLRLYFINHVINPVLYGIMDPQFKTEMKNLKNMLKHLCFKH